MATLWSTFSFWEQAVVMALALVCITAAAGWVLAVCADAFDLDELE